MAMLERLGKTTESTLNDYSNDDLHLDFDDAESVAEEVAAPDVDDAPVVRYLQKILMDAINDGASDIHFEPYERFYRIRFRLDGILREIAQPPLAIKDKLASRIKVISQARHLGEARAAGRPHEARAVEDARDRLPRLDAADAVRREDRDADPRSVAGASSASTRWATSRTRRRR